MGHLISHRRLIRMAAGLIAVIAGPGCRMPHRDRAAETRQVRQGVERTVLARISADRQRLDLRFILKGYDAYATAVVRASGTSALTFQSGARPPVAAGEAASQNVKVLGPAVWREIADTLALRLAPADPAEGTVIFAGGRELVAHRVDGKGRLTPLAQRPARLKIVRRIPARALADEVFLDRDDALDRLAGRDGPVVVLTGTFPELAFVDRKARRLVFLSVPPEDAIAPPLQSLSAGNNIVRQVTSLVWRSHLLAALGNPFSSGARLVASVGSIASAGLGHLFSHLPATPPPPLALRPEMDLQAWDAALTNIASAPATHASLRLQLGGEEFFPAFIQAVQEARRQVDIQLYIFDNDDYAVGLAQLLRQRSTEGIRVRILMDESASLAAATAVPDSPMPADFSPPQDMVNYLRRGSEVGVRCMPMSGLAASHTKIITVDGERAWLGGMNFGREYRYDWHDLMIEVRGPLVPWIQQDFAVTWARHGPGGDFAAARQRWSSPAAAARTAAVPGDAVPVRPLYTNAWRHEIWQAQKEALRRCQRSVWLQNAYLSDHGFITELVRARHRGVDVRVVLPSGNDNALMAAHNRALIPLLRRHGIRVYLVPGMSHVKAALYDGWACVGSANFDRLSLHVNNEFSIGCSDPAFIQQLRQRLFEADFERSREVTAHPRPNYSDELMNTLIRSIAGQF